jgi:two-component system, OmpR family, alkaline phosphatase synthesis response regulator PhoP
MPDAQCLIPNAFRGGLMSLGRILVVEDDAAIRRGLVDCLRFGGYEPVEASDGKMGLERALALDLHLVLLDLLMPRMDGLSMLRELRVAKPHVPVIILTAKGEEDDKVKGLKAGADDYVVKPFSATELLARVEAVLRRSAERPSPVRTIEVEGRRVDLERREVRHGDGSLATLSDKEALVMQYLALHRGRAVSRDELLQRVWGLDPRGVHTRTVDMAVARLREALRDDAEDSKVIATVRGKGYMLAAAALSGGTTDGPIGGSAS